MTNDDAAPTSAQDVAMNDREPGATGSGAPVTEPSSQPSDLVSHLLADVQALRFRDDQLHQRLLDQIERRFSADAALHAERFKVSVLERDLKLVQLRLRTVNAQLETVQRERDELEQALREIRSSNLWRLGKLGWSLRRKLVGR